MRKCLKRLLGISHGMSSVAMELCLKTTGHAILRRMDDAQKAYLPEPPEWLHGAALEHLGWNALLMLDQVHGPGPDLPADVPAEQRPHEHGQCLPKVCFSHEHAIPTLVCTQGKILIKHMGVWNTPVLHAGKTLYYKIDPGEASAR